MYVRCDSCIISHIRASFFLWRLGVCSGLDVLFYDISLVREGQRLASIVRDTYLFVSVLVRGGGVANDSCAGA